MRETFMRFVIIGGMVVYGMMMFFLGKQIMKMSEVSQVARVEVEDEKHNLQKYSLENLAVSGVPSGKLTVNWENESLKFEFDPGIDSGSQKMITGAAHLPEGEGPFPLVLMIRGYVDKETYKTGMGTASAAKVFSEHGYMTLAPDFLGYAESDPESDGILEARFQTYTTVLSLLASLDQVSEWDGKNIFIWAHSNGGQIALSSLAVIQKPIPTTLWAPVTRFFPYSILYYTNELPDRGRYIRRELAQFEKEYDVNEFSFTSYLNGIVGPLQIHQGTADEAVPWTWNSEFSDILNGAEVKHKLYLYEGADHNLRPAWDQVVIRDLDFFEANLKD